MNRRELIKLGGAGFVSAGAGLLSSEAIAQSMCQICVEGSDTGILAHLFELEIGDLAVRMVDGESIAMLGFRLATSDQQLPRVPGPVLRVKEGALVQIKIANGRKETHGFEITGLPETKTEIEPGCSCTVRFTAPQAGTYIYHDAHGGTPLYRILGLHGLMIVDPINGSTPVTSTNPIASRTPYSLDKLAAGPRDAISRLFDALGTTERFLGGAEGKWTGCPLDQEYSNQEKCWVISEVDPKFNALLKAGQEIKRNPSLTSDVVGQFVPRYFTLNSRSGFDLHEGDDCVFANYIGEPSLIRVVNVGLAHHSPHIHGNHVMRLSQANLDRNSPDFGAVEVASNIYEVDTWSMWPMDRRDILLPFEIPPDIPYRIPVGSAQPAQTQFERMVEGRTQEPFPLRYVMHDHNEISQTAAGGNYPQGLVTHFEILGGLGGRPNSQKVASASTPAATPAAPPQQSTQTSTAASDSRRRRR